ncbi:hypothetical protein [Blautia sp. MSK.20.85]|uniref:hypothetical protein n=1 Tax=Blautia sp. MSK.20.85 TaxID=2709718 RepID=UPI001FC8B0E1|nr:hypothetical protein [Blautia sp. MSK.20.85]
MTDRDYAIKSMKEITFQMANHAQNYLEVTIERHYTDIKELMTSYQKLILENQLYWKNWIWSVRRRSMKIWHMR